MGDTWRMNLIVGLLLGGVLTFIIYVMIVSRKQEKEEKEQSLRKDQAKVQDKSQRG